MRLVAILHRRFVNAVSSVVNAMVDMLFVVCASKNYVCADLVRAVEDKGQL